MYQHPSDVKNNRVNIRLDEYELQKLEFLAKRKGMQKTSLVYDVLMEYMKKELQGVEWTKRNAIDLNSTQPVQL